MDAPPSPKGASDLPKKEEGSPQPPPPSPTPPTPTPPTPPTDDSAKPKNEEVPKKKDDVKPPAPTPTPPNPGPTPEIKVDPPKPEPVKPDSEPKPKAAHPFVDKWCRGKDISVGAHIVVQALLKKVPDSDCEKAAEFLSGESSLDLSGLESVNGALDLTPISDFPDLLELSLAKNKMSAPKILEPLKELRKLAVLNLSENKFRSLKDVARFFPNLKRLNLQANEINSMVGLEGFPEIEVLNLSENKIKEFLTMGDPLLHLRELHLDKNKITSVSALDVYAPQLADLYLSDNPLGDKIWNSVAGLPRLRRLWLKNAQLTGVADAADTPSLKWLFIDGNQITRADRIVAAFPNLQQLDLSRNPLSNVPRLPLSLKILSLGKCVLPSLQDYAEFLSDPPVQLERLEVNIEDGDSVSEKVYAEIVDSLKLKLRTVVATTTTTYRMKDLPASASKKDSLTKNEKTFFDWCYGDGRSTAEKHLRAGLMKFTRKTDCADVARALSETKVLTLDKINPVVDSVLILDLTILEQYPNVEEISLRNNRIHDLRGFSPLQHLTAVRRLDLSNNFLESIKEIGTYFPKLEELNLSGNGKLKEQMWEPLTKLPLLKILDATDTGLGDPRVMVDLPLVADLRIGQNLFTTLDDIGTHFPNLVRLDFTKSAKLTKVSLVGMERLTWISFRGCPIAESPQVPKSVTYLDFAGTMVTESSAVFPLIHALPEKLQTLILPLYIGDSEREGTFKAMHWEVQNKLDEAYGKDAPRVTPEESKWPPTFDGK